MAFKTIEERRKYHREWSKNHKEWWIKRKARNKQIINEAKNVPCADCKKTYPFYIMEFDHVEGKKEINISEIASHKHWSEEHIRKEIAKCEVVCSNCHQERTYQRNKKAL